MKHFPIRTIAASLFAIGALATSPARADSIWTADDATVLRSTQSGIDTGFFTSISGPAVLSFDLIGIRSLDGNNDYIDVFTLGFNGVNILSGTFNMSGGGASEVFFAPAGTVWNTVTNTCNGCSDYNYQGGITHFEIPVTVLGNGDAQTYNTVSFAYTSPTYFNGSVRNGFQDVGDEAWRLGAVNINPVPEPETYAMLLAGLGALGVVARRKRGG